MAGLWSESTLALTCERSGTEYLATVGLPARHAQLDAPPVIVCLDGPWVYGTVRDATRLMSMSGEAPEAVVVGLEFVTDSMGEYLRQRARWFSPTPFVPPEATGVKGLTADETGKAAVLMAMLDDQLLPRVTEIAGAGELWFVGHSFSALFGLHCLFSDPGLFDRWLLMSPSIWWDDRSILRFEQAYADSSEDLAAAVFTSSGENEDTPASVATFAMGPNVAELVETLRARQYPGLSIDHQVMPGDAHSSTIGNAVSKGIRSLHSSGAV